MKEKSKALIFIFLGLFIVFFIISLPFYSGDVGNHVVWGRSILNAGPKGFYAREFHDFSVPNYPPLSMFSFALFVRFYDFVRDIVLYFDGYEAFPSLFVRIMDSDNTLISFLKLPAILPFIFSGLFIFYLGNFFKFNFKKSLSFTLIFLLNPAFIYLAVIWGQNDFMQVLFSLLALYFIFIKQLNWSYIAGAFSILSKQTALMVWGIYLVTLYKLYGFGDFLKGVGTALLLIWIFYLPFNESNFFWPFLFYKDSLRTTGLLASDNAINLWGAYSKFGDVDALSLLYNIKLEYWGFGLFIVLFLPLLYKYFKSKFSYQSLFYFLYITSITYFFVLTRMHERYLIFGVVFAHILTMINKKYLPNLIFFSTILLINLYRGLELPRMNPVLDLVNELWFLNLITLIYFVFLAGNYYYFMWKLKDETN